MKHCSLRFSIITFIAYQLHIAAYYPFIQKGGRYNNRIFYEYCVNSDPMCDYRFKQPRSSLTCDYYLYASVYTGLDTVEVLMIVIYYAPRHYDI